MGCGAAEEAALKPEPNCRWCKGTGKIRLLFKAVPCDCTLRDEAQSDDEDVIELVEDDDDENGYHI